MFFRYNQTNWNFLAEFYIFLVVTQAKPLKRSAKYFELAELKLSKRVVIAQQHVGSKVQCSLKCHIHPRCLSASFYQQLCVLYSDDYRNLERTDVSKMPKFHLLLMNSLDCFLATESVIFSATQENNCNLAKKIPPQPIWLVAGNWTEVYNDTCAGKAIVARERNRTCDWLEPQQHIGKLRIDYLKRCEGGEIERQKMSYQMEETGSVGPLLSYQQARNECTSQGHDLFTSIHWFCEVDSEMKPDLASSFDYWTGFRLLKNKGDLHTEPENSERITIDWTQLHEDRWDDGFPLMDDLSTCIQMTEDGKLKNHPCNDKAQTKLICDKYEDI